MAALAVAGGDDDAGAEDDAPHPVSTVLAMAAPTRTALGRTRRDRMRRGGARTARRAVGGACRDNFMPPLRHVRSGDPSAAETTAPAGPGRDATEVTDGARRCGNVGGARQYGSMPSDLLDGFSPATRAWFDGAFAEPTQAQAGAWRAIDKLAALPPPADPKRRTRVLYVSPLKALAVDIERNLRAPLTGIRHAAQRLGLDEPDIRVAVRTGDTAAEERRKLVAKPPDILITTPESLFLLLTSQARETLRGIETVILDEVHAVAGNKRGAHLALSLERLDALRGQDENGTR